LKISAKALKDHPFEIICQIGTDHLKFPAMALKESSFFSTIMFWNDLSKALKESSVRLHLRAHSSTIMETLTTRREDSDEDCIFCHYDASHTCYITCCMRYHLIWMYCSLRRHHSWLHAK
jgi:hypothetical protein